MWRIGVPVTLGWGVSKVLIFVKHLIVFQVQVSPAVRKESGPVKTFIS